VVASDVAALAEIVTPEMNGLLHEKGSAESLTEQLTALLDDTALRSRLGAQAREWVVAERTWSSLAGRLAAVNEEIANLLTPLLLDAHLGRRFHTAASQALPCVITDRQVAPFTLPLTLPRTPRSSDEPEDPPEHHRRDRARVHRTAHRR